MNAIFVEHRRLRKRAQTPPQKSAQPQVAGGSGSHMKEVDFILGTLGVAPRGFKQEMSMFAFVLRRQVWLQEGRFYSKKAQQR